MAGRTKHNQVLISSPSSSSSSFQAVIDTFSISTSQNLQCQRDREDNIGDPDHQYDNKSMNNNGSVKYWMSSKMRLMEKMSNPETCATSTDDKGEKTAQKVLQYSPRQDNSGQAKFNFSRSNGTTVRVCSDCNTTSTPLWRSGPRGPKVIIIIIIIHFNPLINFNSNMYPYIY